MDFYKILLLGEASVGKTCLLLRYTEDKFSSIVANTIGVDFKRKDINVDGKLVQLQIWDTAGAERYQSVTKAYFHGSLGVLVVFDLTRKSTFEKAANWIDLVREANGDKTDIILVGNKCDCDQEVTSNEASELADKYQIKYFEASAKDSTNVVESFESLAREINARVSKQTAKESHIVKIDGDNGKESGKGNGKKGCC